VADHARISKLGELCWHDLIFFNSQDFFLPLSLLYFILLSKLILCKSIDFFIFINWLVWLKQYSACFLSMKPWVQTKKIYISLKFTGKLSRKYSIYTHSSTLAWLSHHSSSLVTKRHLHIIITQSPQLTQGSVLVLKVIYYYCNNFETFKRWRKLTSLKSYTQM
jgi:hypothetical protein